MYQQDIEKGGVTKGGVVLTKKDYLTVCGQELVVRQVAITQFTMAITNFLKS
jgi:hypothetical protein